jgi:FkbM family methyltransferase
MLKRLISRVVGSMGYELVSRDHLGVTLENDLERITSQNPIRCIFDVGANAGQSARRFSIAFPQSRIYSFEPVKRTFAELQQMAASIPAVSVFNQAMGDAPGTATIYLAKESGSNSMVPGQDSSLGKETVEVDTIDRFCADQKIDAIDLLKIDVEGFELPVLRGAERMLNDGRIRFIYAECEFTSAINAPHATFVSLYDALSRYDYSVAGIYSEAFDLSRGALLANVLFARRSMLPGTASGRIRNIF